ncbi:hypothetical protein SC020_12655 [Legionella pneumophila serogroup 1]
MSPRLPKVIYQIFNLQLLRRYAPRNDGPKNRTVQREIIQNKMIETSIKALILKKY